MGKNAQRRPRVLVAGGGVAALEASLALRALAGDQLDVGLYSPRGEFVYRPFAIGEPHGATVLRHDLAALAEWIGVSFHLGGIAAVDVGARRAIAHDGARIPFDHLLVASGARMLRAVPGAITFWGATDEGRVDWVVRKLRAGILRDVVFTVPDGPGWVLPVYELALLATAVLSRSGIEDARIAVVTPEKAPLQVLGPPASERMTRLLGERGVEVISAAPVEFDGRRLRVARGDAIETDAVVSLPRLEGHRIDGLTADADGFLRVDEEGRVAGADGVFAAGDATAAPVKRAGIAAREADIAAAAVAAAAGCEIDSGAAAREAEPNWAEQDGKIEGRYLTRFLAALSGGKKHVLASG
jgi:sulfide:quinone oxidoreductase